MKKMMKLPIGIEDFEHIRAEGFYYVDKTGLIKELLDSMGMVTLFTRPRRFGKSLNMNMLQYFFEYGCDSSLFDGLEISGEQEYCGRYMGKFPVISITLKDVCGENYEMALGMLRNVIGREALRFQFLTDSPQLTDVDRMRYKQLIEIDTSNRQGFAMPQEALMASLLTLCQLLQKHYGQKAILLIDEYDVPLDKAQHAGYYNEMIALIRSLLSQCLKSNSSLYFAVLTGCLRVAKESIFTGLNNLKVFSTVDEKYDRYFGFTDSEVRDMLKYYGIEDKISIVREWYDGYRFGGQDVYCPWDVINYVDLLRSKPDARPGAYWINTSGNDIMKQFIQMASPRTRQEIESLIEGKAITRRVDMELTYRDLYKNIDNMWSVLFTTGYLTQRGEPEKENQQPDVYQQLDIDGQQDIYQLVIPNQEIRQIFIRQIREWFQEEVRRDTPTLDAFCAAFPEEDAETAERLLNVYLSKTISIRDTSVRKNKKENFYHGILLGLLSHREDWYLSSNAESGDGYSDILIEIPEKELGIVIEVKYSEKGNMEKSCEEALEQIEKMGYEDRLRQDGMETVMGYGIACYKKRCRVRGRTFAEKRTS